MLLAPNQKNPDLGLEGKQCGGRGTEVVGEVERGRGGGGERGYSSGSGLDSELQQLLAPTASTQIQLLWLFI